MAASVELLDVSRFYASGERLTIALRDVTVSFQPATFTALVGRSGCGKSTLLNIAGAMDRPTRGEVRILGDPVHTLSDAALTRLRRSQVGFVFQFFNLLPTLTVAENIELPLLLDGVRGFRWQAREALRRVDLWERRDHLPHQLSGGEMQRVAIARALVNNPVVLIADEPTGNLDSINAQTVLRLLAAAARDSGTTVIMATHSLETAVFADRMLIMKDGAIEREADPAEMHPEAR